MSSTFLNGRESTGTMGNTILPVQGIRHTARIGRELGAASADGLGVGRWATSTRIGGTAGGLGSGAGGGVGWDRRGQRGATSAS